MAPDTPRHSQPPPGRDPFFYGWVIVAACTVLLMMQAGIQYSFGIFFKPLLAHFGWSRAATSGVYALYLVSHGAFAIPIGWLADRFGPARLVAACGFLAGLGLILTSQITALWQLYLVYGIMVGLGLSSGFAIGTGTTARWFLKRRGLALGVVSAGIGVGTLLMAPVAERLIAVYDWNRAYILVGLSAWVFMIGSGLFLRRNPESMGCRPYGSETAANPLNSDSRAGAGRGASEAGVSLLAAARTRPLWLLVVIYCLFNFCTQMIMVHLVNYATDMGVSALVAATFISVIGIGSLVGRLAMGAASDRIGSSNAVIICCIIVMICLVWLVFSREPWMFYVFAILFGFAYGGEVPQMAVLIGQFFGLRAVAALVGTVYVGSAVGGALGSLVGGKIFDMTQSYHTAFLIAVAASSVGLVLTFALKKMAGRHTPVSSS